MRKVFEIFIIISELTRKANIFVVYISLCVRLRQLTDKGYYEIMAYFNSCSTNDQICSTLSEYKCLGRFLSFLHTFSEPLMNNEVLPESA